MNDVIVTFIIFGENLNCRQTIYLNRYLKYDLLMKLISLILILSFLFSSGAYSKGYEFFCNQKYCGNGPTNREIELIFFENGTFSLNDGFQYIGIWKKRGTRIMLSSSKNITPNEIFMNGYRFFMPKDTYCAQICRNGSILINRTSKGKSRLCRRWICYCHKRQIRSFCSYKALLSPKNE